MKLFQRLPVERLSSLLRRLAAQGVMSAIVMAGLHAASGSGAAFKEWLTTPDDAIAANEPAPSVAAGPQFTFVAVPASKALPQREIANSHPVATPSNQRPSPTQGDAGEKQARPIAQATAPRSVAIPTPRPVRIAMATPSPAPRSIETRPADLPFDLSARRPAEASQASPAGRTAVPDAPELATDAAVVPEPGETSSFTLGGLVPTAFVPSGQGLLRGAGDATLMASDAVVGTASRILDLVR